jgi:hypothetical protein
MMEEWNGKKGIPSLMLTGIGKMDKYRDFKRKWKKFSFLLYLLRIRINHVSFLLYDYLKSSTSS